MKKIIFLIFSVFMFISVGAMEAPPNMKLYRGNNGKTYTFSVYGSTEGRIWGGQGNIYTDDSSIAMAAVHAGLLRPGERAEIQVTVLRDQGSYPSITRNGITSRSYSSYYGSYRLSRKGTRQEWDAIGVDEEELVRGYTNAPPNMKLYRGHNGTTYTFAVYGSTEGRIWGGKGNIYTDDSSIDMAAVHAGIVDPGHRAVVKVTVLRDQGSYPSINRNGITSRSYGAYSGSYKISRVKSSRYDSYNEEEYMEDAPYNMKAYRDQDGSSFTFIVVGTTEGRIWGGYQNIYTDDSCLGKAVVHAGFVRPGEKAKIKVLIRADQGSYPSITRNGITSRRYGEYEGSYQITLIKKF